MWGISYWFLPLFASLVWLAMLLTMLVTWISKGKPHYASMDPAQHIAYISDVGAHDLKPLFIAMSSVTVVSLDLAFIAERWLRHRGRLTQNTSMLQKALSALSIICAIVGAAGLILLSIFDNARHPSKHVLFLSVFIVGYILSAIFICWEYQRLGAHFRELRILRISFWIKLFFIIVEIALAILFGAAQRQKHYNIAAVGEWTIALIFTLYLFSFFIDFIPAVRTKHHQSRETQVEMAYGESGRGVHQPAVADGRFSGNASEQPARTYNGPAEYPQTNGMNGYASGQPGVAGGAYIPKAHPHGTQKPHDVPASRNF